MHLENKIYSLYLLLLMIFYCGACEHSTLPDNFDDGQSTFFSTVYIEPNGYDTPSNGDLWPSAWSDDNLLYAANGDGKGFGPDKKFSDLVVNKIYGHPIDHNIKGERLAEEVGPIWGDTSSYNRKPTGMISVNGQLYLAVQDLNKGNHIFDEAPSATILRSDDKGLTWKKPGEKAMFKDHIFTTVMFLDYGKDSRNNTFDKYIYAYGLDHNWRDSFTDVVKDPVCLYLARIPADGLQDPEKWEYYTGGLHGRARWSAPGNIENRRPVLKDERRRYTHTFDFKGIDSLSVISQGSIVYNKPLSRYIYTSWTEYTFEFYEAPQPWGPWKLFLSKDFGIYPWDNNKYGGYATVIPSKYISSDGTEMWISSSTFAGQSDHYNFSLRKLIVTPYRSSEPSNRPDKKNIVISMSLKDAVPIAAGNIRYGDITILNDKIKNHSIDSYSTEITEKDYWGYTFSKAYHFNKLIYTTGKIETKQGGWYEDIKIEVRQNFQWLPVQDFKMDRSYAFDETVQSYSTYTFNFKSTWGDGIRLIGRPGGKKQYTSIAELEVFYE